MRRIDASTARRSFSRLYHEVAYGGERIVVENHGKGLVAIVPVADLEHMTGVSGNAEEEAPNRGSCLDILRRERSFLEKAGVSHIALFGSVARGEARLDSDIDVLVDFAPNAHLDLFDFAGLRERLAQAFGRPVDLVSRRALKADRDEAILRDAVYAF